MIYNISRKKFLIFIIVLLEGNMTDKLDDLSYEEIVDKDIIELLGAQDFSDEEKGLLYEKMLETIRTRMMIRFDNTLTEEEKEKFKEIANINSGESINQFMEEKGFDVDKVMTEEAIKYKIELVASMKMINSGAQVTSKLENQNT